ncbi:fumarylacetoacetase [Hydrogenophaga pseudoflava]|uniref:fumarylacetoacetase n=1 Tax=Hydrogenophaga pseudoflava TaxID=47421 RepID=UPI0027E3DC2B|nr:fumarylacetoacetase [Hydrogenophaga pseudoflava]MDQ7743920.1 fumarylacetoacetase [Hydrogenophaga pseudoflava]
MSSIDHTHDPALTSWVESANAPDTDFPVQNLPFGRFRVEDDPEWRIGVAIGDQVLDLRGAGLINHSDMNRLIRLKPETRRELRAQISAGLATGSAQAGRWERHLHAQSAVEPGLPCEIRDYTDFYIGIHHATAVGKLFRPDNPLLPNYEWVPIGYHGRASTLQVSGRDFHRPKGQVKAADAAAPVLGPSQRLDLELELGFVIGRPNAMGHAIPLAEAEDHLFGVTLFNDWSARDLQAWEYQPLGPFLSKNFASTLSAWMVTLDALAPFRTALRRPAGHPDPLPYLDTEANRRSGAMDIDLDVLLQTRAMRDAGVPPEVISRSNAAEAAFWTPAQLVAHHTVNGCALSAGDLFGSGTLSGPLREQAGSLLEMTEGGKRAITLANGETRSFLQDGDRIQLRGRCARDGFRSIGFGDCSATVLPAL